MWCWISLKWDFLRVAVFYAPVWMVIFLTLALHVRIGLRIFQKGHERRRLHDELQRSRRLPITPNPFLATSITKTTAIAVIYESTSARQGEPTPFRAIAGADEMRTAGPKSPPTYSFTMESGSPVIASSSATQSLRTSLTGSRSWDDGNWSSAMTKAEWSYYKCALLFFVAVIVTWVPSSANRVYSLVFPEKVSFGLSLASGLVLPLQGFWNTLIYVTTSWPACKALYERLVVEITGPPIMKRRSGSTSTEPKEPAVGDALEKR